MINNEELTQIYRLTKKMREAQKGFFSTVNGADQKRRHLIESKRLEREVDKLIIKIESGQEELF